MNSLLTIGKAKHNNSRQFASLIEIAKITNQVELTIANMDEILQ